MATTPATGACFREAISSPSPTRAARGAAKARPTDMSLLLEALKKAERAKEEAQRRSRGGDDAPKAELDFAANAEPVVTRDQLPDIRQPLEIQRDEVETPAPPPAQEKPPEARPADRQATERATARKVFEAKFKEPNPRLPFFITMAALGVFAVGTVVYFWIQLQPPPALVNANPPRPSSQAQVAAAETRPTATAPIAAAPQSAPSSIPGLPGSAPA